MTEQDNWDRHDKLVASFSRELSRARETVSDTLRLLVFWHQNAEGHHPDESCCDVTAAIERLEKYQKDART